MEGLGVRACSMMCVRERVCCARVVTVLGGGAMCRWWVVGDFGKVSFAKTRYLLGVAMFSLSLSLSCPRCLPFHTIPAERTRSQS